MQEQSFEQVGADSSTGTERANSSVFKADCVVAAIVVVSFAQTAAGGLWVQV